MPRCATLTRRAQPTTPSSTLAIWVTDALLRQAIDRFHRKFSTQCRHLTFRPGPLESRRRANKRNLTAHIPTSTPPFWNFDVQASDTWTWQPPSQSETRRQRTLSQHWSTRVKSLLTWLEASDSDKPFLTPPSDLVADDTLSSSTIPDEILELRRELASLEVISADAILTVTRRYATLLSQRISGGNVSLAEVYLALSPFDAESKITIQDAQVELRATSVLQQSVTNAIIKHVDQNPEIWSLGQWRTLFTKLVPSPALSLDQQTHLFRKMFACMPDSIRSQLAAADLVPFVLSSLVLQATKPAEHPDRTRAVLKLGRFMKRTSLKQSIELDRAVTKWIDQSHMSRSLRAELGTAWNLAKSCSPIFTDEVMSHASTLQPADVNHSRQVLIGRMVALDIFEKSVLSRLALLPGTPSAQWSNTIVLLERQVGPHALSKLHTILKDTGYLQHFTDIMLTPPLKKKSVQAAALFAQHCNDAQYALDLFQHIERCGFVDTQVWTSQTWMPHLETLVTNPESELRLLQALRLTNTTSRTVEWGRNQKDQAGRMALLDELARCYLRTPHLTDRQRLRRLQACLEAQTLLTGKASTSVLAGLAEVILRDLENGQAGRTERLRWLLKLVAEGQSADSAEEARAMLIRWRNANAQRLGMAQPRLL